MNNDNRNNSPLRILLVRTSRAVQEHYLYNPVSHPLGLMYLSSTLKQSFGSLLEVKICDLRIRDNYLELLKDFQPNIIGFSVLTCEAFFLPELIDQARKYSLANQNSTESPLIIIGGPHASSAPTEILLETTADLVCPGEGEKILSEIVTEVLNSFMNNSSFDFSRISGIYFREANDSNTIIFNEPLSTPEPVDLNALPFPD